MHDYCLNCHIPIAFEPKWTTLFLPQPAQYLCNDCENKLIPIKPPICHTCGRPMENLPKEYIVEETLCLDCQRWEEDQKWKGVLDKNISCYEYDDFLKDIIARFKFRGDYILSKIFSRKINEILKTLDYDSIVSIPLSQERLKERGFNQATALANEAGLQVMDILHRTHTEKQSKKSRQERIQLQQIFTLSNPSAIMNRSIILIDDIYTTGSTLRHAAKELKEAGANSVTALTVARG